MHGNVMQPAPFGGGFPGGVLLGGAYLRKALLHAFGHEGGEQGEAHAEGLDKVIHNGCKPCTVGFHILCQHPWRGLVDILIGAGDNTEHLAEGILRAELIHKLFVFIPKAFHHAYELIVHGV